MTLREYITQEQLTVANFAKRIGVTPRTIWNYMRGARKPKFEIMEKIMKVTKSKVKHADFKGVK